ncbi:MAG: hypothetical protein MI757_21245 [Pirellulales bacterium]|nr:hypothetical protein [Pirellulales bacterium]
MVIEQLHPPILWTRAIHNTRDVVERREGVDDDGPGTLRAAVVFCARGRTAARHQISWLDES